MVMKTLTVNFFVSVESIIWVFASKWLNFRTFEVKMTENQFEDVRDPTQHLCAGRFQVWPWVGLSLRVHRFKSRSQRTFVLNLLTSTDHYRLLYLQLLSDSNFSITQRSLSFILINKWMCFHVSFPNRTKAIFTWPVECPLFTRYQPEIRETISTRYSHIQ